jgi:hypothetical protein
VPLHILAIAVIGAPFCANRVLRLPKCRLSGQKLRAGDPPGQSKAKVHGYEFDLAGAWKSRFTSLHGTMTKANLARTSTAQDVDSTVSTGCRRRCRAETGHLGNLQAMLCCPEWQ